MQYEVKDERTREVISTHRTEKAAIKKAKELGCCTVVAHEISGTYESRMVVWPTQGECYTN